MLNKDIFNKFDKLVKKYELDDALLNDLASAICTADMLFGTNEKQLDINRFIASTDGRFGGVGVIVPKQPIPFQKEEPNMTIKSNSEKLGQGVGFERIRRITGYLVGTMDKWNDAKRAEERDRVKHGMNGNA